MQILQKMKHIHFPKLSLRQLNKDEKGFTLIELLAVIVILGVIAAIAIPSVSAVMRNSEGKAQVSNAKQIIEAAQLAVMERSFAGIGEKLDSPPAYTSGYITDISAKTGDKKQESRAIEIKDLVERGYLEASPEDPKVRGSRYDDENSFVVAVLTEYVDEQNLKVVEWDYFITLVSSEADPEKYYEGKHSTEIK